MLDMRGLVVSIVFLFGCGLTLYGLALLNPAFAFIAGGVLAVFCSITASLGKKAGK